MFVETSPGPVKYGASLLGWGDGSVRLPLVSASPGARESVEKAMRQVGLID